MKKTKNKNIDRIFEDLIRDEMTAGEFWRWVESWYDAEEIIGIALEWNEKDKKETIKDYKKGLFNETDIN